MDKRWLIIGFSAGIISFGLITSGVFDRSPSPASDIKDTPSVSSSLELQSETSRTSEDLKLADPIDTVAIESSDIRNHEQLVEKAQQDVVSAQFALEEAENDLNGLESEMIEVEKFIESLEQQGDDPANFAEEGMLLLRPVIEKYELKLATVEAAEKRLEEARRILADYKN